MHVWASAMQPGLVLLANVVTLTYTRTEGAYCTNELCIMNTFFQQKRICKYTWCRNSWGQRSLIDFCFVLADLHQGNQCGSTYLQRENAPIMGTFVASVSMIKLMLNAFKKKCGEIVGSI